MRNHLWKCVNHIAETWGSPCLLHQLCLKTPMWSVLLPLCCPYNDENVSEYGVALADHLQGRDILRPCCPAMNIWTACQTGRWGLFEHMPLWVWKTDGRASKSEPLLPVNVKLLEFGSYILIRLTMPSLFKLLRKVVSSCFGRPQTRLDVTEGKHWSHMLSERQRHLYEAYICDDETLAGSGRC